MTDLQVTTAFVVLSSTMSTEAIRQVQCICIMCCFVTFVMCFHVEGCEIPHLFYVWSWGNVL